MWIIATIIELFNKVFPPKPLTADWVEFMHNAIDQAKTDGQLIMYDMHVDSRRVLPEDERIIEKLRARIALKRQYLKRATCKTFIQSITNNLSQR